MLLHGKVYIDKALIVGKVPFEIEAKDIHITNAFYNEDGTVDITFVVSVPDEVYNSSKDENLVVGNKPPVRRVKL